jgi:hypothetical protein
MTWLNKTEGLIPTTAVVIAIPSGASGWNIEYVIPTQNGILISVETGKDSKHTWKEVEYYMYLPHVPKSPKSAWCETDGVIIPLVVLSITFAIMIYLIANLMGAPC